MRGVDGLEVTMWFRRIERHLDVLADGIQYLIEKDEAMSQQLEDLKVKVAECIAVETSAIALLNGLSAQILALKDDPAALEALAAEIDSSSDALAAAVTANTPVVP